MTPLARSVLQFAAEDWIFIPGYSKAGRIGGCLYLKPSVIASLSHALGWSGNQLMESLGLLVMKLPGEMVIHFRARQQL